MKASIDTDVVIHLYSSNKQNLFFEIFDELFMYEFLYKKELKKKSHQVYEKLSADVILGKVTIVTNQDLLSMGVKSLFDECIIDYEYLFDRGEMFAVALAKTMGLLAFVSDDTKEFGPHDTLVKNLIEDVIPFAFYELLYLKYLSGDITAEKMHSEFNEIAFITMNKRPMRFRSRMLRTVRRFSCRNGTQRDYGWICEYCDSKHINYKEKMINLKNYLDKIE